MQEDSQPGRSCPLHYRYGPASLARAAEAECETLYVVGGLYGNEPALDTLLALFDQERGPKRLVFNGDFHWFDTDAEIFQRINRRVLAFDALRGNVETEIAAPSAAEDSAGCGCAYPAWVDDGVVERSNRILQRLRSTAAGLPHITARLAALDMTRRVDVAGLRVAVVHGDAESLAGWGLAQEHLQERPYRQQARRWFDESQVDAFACSHTCLPVFHSLPMPGRALTPVVLNNGAAGMPNFRGECSGLLTRISVQPFTGPQRRHGLRSGALHIDALAIEFDTMHWQSQFERQWPAASDAHASYWQRIVQGPAFEPGLALVTSVG